MEKNILIYGNRVFGVEISDYALEHGYLDYKTLANMLQDCISNNDIYHFFDGSEWEHISGNAEKFNDVSQYFIISKHGKEILMEYTDQLVYYHFDTNLYIWAVPYFGTAWDYVLTDTKLEFEDHIVEKRNKLSEYLAKGRIDEREYRKALRALR